jgi:magnesium-protoporphyrin O-methyltransferase
MNCTCCGPHNINDLDNTFDAKRAAREAKSYLENGLGTRAEKLIAYLVEHPSRPVSVLDIGCGVGAVHYELLRRSIAKRAIGVEAASAYIEAARDIGEQLNLKYMVSYVPADFTVVEEGINAVDVVILDRVICCYPYLSKLMDAAVQKARRFLLLSYPRETWWVRIGLGLENGWRKLRGQEFRTYLHPHNEVHSIAIKNGLKPVYGDTDGVWQITAFERA